MEHAAEKKTPDATTLVYINQYNADKQNLEKNAVDVDKKYLAFVLY